MNIEKMPTVEVDVGIWGWEEKGGRTEISGCMVLYTLGIIMRQTPSHT